MSGKEREKYYNIIEAMQKNYGYDIDEEMRQYVADSPNSVKRATGKMNARAFRLINMNVQGVYTQFGQSVSAMMFDIIVECELAASVVVEDTPCFDDVVTGQFDLRFILDMTVPLGRIWPPRVVPARDVFGHAPMCTGMPLNEYFEPVLETNDDYDRFAALFLSVFNKTALNRPVTIRGTDLAKKIGLTIRTVRFAYEKDVKGRTYFVKKDEALLDKDGKIFYDTIMPGTILINEARLRSEEDQNTTIIHECVHVFKDFYFFELQRMAGAKVELYTSRKTSGKRTGSDVIDKMEMQAERLPAFIMMPAATTRAFIEDELEELGGFLSPTNMRMIAVRLSMRFGVSMLMARNRMIELGYPEANGVCQFVSGMEVPSHGCSEGWAKDAVFQISMEKATRLFDDYPDFAEAVASRRYVYVDGFYVISSRKYVNQNADGSLSLKQAALQHMEECCVAFSRDGGPEFSASYQFGTASRRMTNTERAQWGLKPINLPVVSEPSDEDTLFEDEKLWDQLLEDMRDSVPCALDAILSFRGMSRNALAERFGISRSNISKWYSTGRIPKGQVAAICLELELRGDVGNRLAKLAGIRWNKRKDEDTALRMFISHQEKFSCITANDYLVKKKYGMLLPRTELATVSA